MAVQQTLELLYSLLPSGNWRRYQKQISKALAILVGSVWTASAWRQNGTTLPFDELLLAGLVTAASAEFVNAAIKLLIYAKERKKAAAADALSTAGSISLEAVSRK